MTKNYGFNTFLTIECLPLVEVLIESILDFSKYSIVVNCINFTHDFKEERVKTNTINLDCPTFNAICMIKWLSLLNNPYDICAILDADMIATKEIDLLFETNEQKISNSKFPLFAKHPHNPFSNPMHEEHLKNLCKYFSGNTPKMKWVYACGIVAKHHKDFLSELASILYSFYEQGLSPYMEDEGLLNALLTKYEVNEDLGYNHIPNASLSLIKAYIKNNLEDKELYETYLKNNCPVEFYLFHGCKDPIEARNIYYQIKQK
jgi:alpha-N-acetylglucosamine transferase